MTLLPEPEVTLPARLSLLEKGQPVLIHDARRLIRSPTGQIFRATYHLPRASLQ